MADPFVTECLAVLTRAPQAFDSLLRALPESWVRVNEGPGTWTPFDVMGHLVHAERTDWIPRLRTILNHGPGRPFAPFDREAQFRESEGKTLDTLLDQFTAARRESVRELLALDLEAGQLDAEGTHPALGRVTARQLLATWTAHDLAHLLQVSRAMAKRLKPEVGPWAQFLSVMK